MVLWYLVRVFPCLYCPWLLSLYLANFEMGKGVNGGNCIKGERSGCPWHGLWTLVFFVKTWVGMDHLTAVLLVDSMGSCQKDTYLLCLDEKISISLNAEVCGLSGNKNLLLWVSFRITLPFPSLTFFELCRSFQSLWIFSLK